MATPSAVSLGSCVSGIPVTLHYSFFLLLLLEFVNAVRLSGTYPMYMLFVAALYGPVLLLTIVVHEFGHALVAKRLGGSVGGIVLWPLGGFALCGPTEALGGELKVALAGPATHVPMGIVWYLVFLVATGGKSGWWPPGTIYLDVLSSGVAGFFEILSAQALFMNIALLCFNLFLPAYPLDGGRIYAAGLMLAFKLRGATAARVTAVTAMVVSSGMILYALVGVLYGAAGGELLLGFVGVYVFYQSYELHVAARRDDLADHPIFGRECYRGAGGTDGGGGGDGGGPGTAPVPADSAVPA
mmetsp:Transcript_5925/g.13033  ORF Transcript_5925/g.13033 Transcript_5925/m.13033 type:complete len:299 (+) Transcript_5925:32-928(+)|eukprot:CAMPEP_0172527150 /NCGR_PEP_ID=MMETSP1067-20121228/1900_1 /TAXON_ID=265564 ORGANISM="Thalassiosira punctigera, Strain Tpunct2005C2" /NCGR_SAMPLE_ID=MMETSP1067 /ASSEMBLY_ACC=CAM_ASM_000444 /LENGTH=298 /DNA_ID=CAMNT_0013310825 /DNA_START=25 /DNA_END=921 /DNA_ORIENTATION=-